MRESLRARLLVWHTITTAVVIAGFGLIVCYLAWHDRVTEIDRALMARASALAAAVQPAGADRVDVMPNPALDPGPFYHALWTRDGRLVDRSAGDDPIAAPAAIGLRTRAGRRELSVRAVSGVVLLVGRDLDDSRAAVGALAARLGTVGAIVLALSIGAAWGLARRTLAPLSRIALTARRMAEGDLAARILVTPIETELEQVARALNGAFDRLQASVDRQRRFTADASHELRTPLAVLSTETQWALAGDRAHEELRRSLEVSARAGARMQRVVARLLELARGSESHGLRVAIALDALAADAVAQLAPLAERRGVITAIDVPPLMLVGDPDRLLEAFAHVIGNAVQYSRAGGVVRIAARADVAGLELSVADTGAGIDDGDLPFVFDPFYRGSAARRCDPEGAGLGLAVTRAVIEQHGGSISCDSAPGRGTTVAIRLPAAPAT